MSPKHKDGYHGQQAPRSHRHTLHTYIKAPFSTSFRNVLWVISAPGPHTLTSPAHSCHIAPITLRKQQAQEEFPKLLPLAHLHSCTWTDPSLLAHIYHFILSHLSTPFLYVFFFFSTPLTYKYTPKTKQQKSYFTSHQASLNSSVSHLSSIFLLLINFSDSLWGLCICGL